MIIKPDTPQAEKIRKLFMQILNEKGFKNLRVFCVQNGLVYRKVYQRIFYSRNIHLSQINDYISLCDKDRKLIIVGDDVRISIG